MRTTQSTGNQVVESLNTQFNNIDEINHVPDNIRFDLESNELSCNNDDDCMIKYTQTMKGVPYSSPWAAFIDDSIWNKLTQSMKKTILDRFTGGFMSAPSRPSNKHISRMSNPLLYDHKYEIELVLNIIHSYTGKTRKYVTISVTKINPTYVEVLSNGSVSVHSISSKGNVKDLMSRYKYI